MPHRAHIRDLWEHHEALTLATHAPAGEVYRPHLVQAEQDLIAAVFAVGGRCDLGAIVLHVEECRIGGVLTGRWITARGDHATHAKTCTAHVRVASLRTSIRKWRRGPALALDLAALKAAKP